MWRRKRTRATPLLVLPVHRAFEVPLPGREWRHRGGSWFYCPTCPDHQFPAPPKLLVPAAESHAAGMETVNAGSVLNNAVGECPLAKVSLGGVELWCLLDTEAQVSMIKESFYRDNCAEELVDMGSMLRISSVQGLDIPYVGYVELDLAVLGEQFCSMGFLVIKNP